MSRFIKFLSVGVFVFSVCTQAFCEETAAESDANYRRIQETSDLIRDLQAKAADNRQQLASLEERMGTMSQYKDEAQEKIVVSAEEPRRVEEAAPYVSMSPDIVKEHQFEVAPEISYITYEEPDMDVTDKGMMYGVFGSYEYRPTQTNAFTSILNVLHADTHFNFGFLDYEGSGTLDNIDQYLFETRLWIGREIAMGETYLTPYVGFGYRWFYDNSGGEITSTGATAYDRQSQYFYLPIGANFRFNLAEGWKMVLNAEYDIFLKGYQDSLLGQYAGYTDLENTQDEGFGVRGSIKFLKNTESINFLFEPYIRYWSIEDSDIKAYQTPLGQRFGYEPKNTSTEIGARAGVEF